MSIPLPPCLTCKHYRGELKCAAFPQRIPEEIIMRKNDHRLPYPGDNGIQYERKLSDRS